MIPMIDKQQAAIKLRHDGKAANEIARILNVSNSSVYLWTKGIKLTPEQKKDIWHASGRKEEWSNKCSLKRKHWQDEGRFDAQNKILLHAMGCMLYWAEGGKDRNQLNFTNSDYRMVQLFLKFLRESFLVKDENVAIAINCFTDCGMSLETIQRFWLNALGLPITCMRKCTVNKYSKYSQGKRKGKLKYGTCCLRVSNTKVLQRIYGAIQEYGQFIDDEWIK
jgi:hypothetical protein